MKSRILLSIPIATICLAASTQSRPLDSILRALNFPGYQAPLNPPNLAMPPVSGENPAPDASSGIIISDVIGKTQNIAIFSELTRDVDAVDDRLNDASKNATVLAPDNGVMRSLKRKPWDDPKDVEKFGANAYEGQAGEDRAHRNMRRFVESHIVPESPWKENQKLKTLAGNEVWFESKDGKKMIQPGDIEVVSIADKVSNGEVWVINGVLVKQ